MLRTLEELVNQTEPAIQTIRELIAVAENDCEILPPSEQRDNVLLELQVTTRSTLGSIAYETGGILVDHGWLRFLGSGHPKLTRNLAEWNRGRSNGFFLVADDAVGGFYALNGGAFGDDMSNVYYWAPDNLQWVPLQLGFTDFFHAVLTSRLAKFYETLRWPGWEGDVALLPTDQCFAFYPFLWTNEGSVSTSFRGPVPIDESFSLKADFIRQMSEQ